MNLAEELRQFYCWLTPEKEKALFVGWNEVEPSSNYVVREYLKDRTKLYPATYAEHLKKEKPIL